MELPLFDYGVEPIIEDGELADLRLRLADGRVWHLWGRRAGERERDLADAVSEGALPVVLGAGLGVLVRELAGRGPVVVVDREEPMLAVSGVRRQHADHPRVHWLDGDAEQVMARVATLAAETGATEVQPVRVPLYQRLDPGHYGLLAERVASLGAFRSTMSYPKFAAKEPRVLLLVRPYFLYREIEAALDRLGIEHRAVDLPDSERVSPEFLERLLSGVGQFKPDFALTVNHFGLDREGKLAGLLGEIGLPLASWFVDSPQLILYRYPRLNTPLTTVFTYDAGNVPWLREAGFAEVHYLPLATDPHRFSPQGPVPAAWSSQVSFVGESMLGPVEEMVAATGLGDEFADALPRLADGFMDSAHPDAARYLEQEHPGWHAELEALPTKERQLALEKSVTFMAAGRYRRRCVRELLPFSPLIAGDGRWDEVLGPGGWRAAGRIDYYRELSAFYRGAQVNFNCTSAQMKGAVNQRVFDVPACGGFLVTDRREQMDALFEPGREVVVYGGEQEIGEVVAAWLADPQGRAGVAERARRRVLAEHTYEHRLRRLVETMRQSVSTTRSAL